MKTLQEASAAIRAATLNALDAQLSSARSHLSSLEQARDYICRNPDAMIFEVSISSNWADEGEKSVTVRSGRYLSVALKSAQTRFKKLNNRSTIDARYSARVFLSRDIRTKSTISFPIDKSFLSSLI